MVRKNRGTYGFLGISWVLITMAPRNNASLCYLTNEAQLLFSSFCFLFCFR